MDKEQIINKLNEYYGEDIFLFNGPVGIINPFYGRNLAVEMGGRRLGHTPEEIQNNVDGIIRDYPKDDYYFCFYKVYTKASDRLFHSDLFEEGSRIPKRVITDSDIEQYGDLYIRFDAKKKEDYKNKTSIYRHDILNSSIPYRCFYFYNCDELYKKEMQRYNKYLTKFDTYSMTPVESSTYLVKKVGFFEYTNKDDLEIKKQELESSLGELFLEYIDINRVGLVKHVAPNKEEVFTFVVDTPITIRPLVSDANIEKLSKLEVSTYDEFVNIRNLYTEHDYSHLTVPMFNMSKYHKCPIMDITEYYKKYENGYINTTYTNEFYQKQEFILQTLSMKDNKEYIDEIEKSYQKKFIESVPTEIGVRSMLEEYEQTNNIK